MTTRSTEDLTFKPVNNNNEFNLVMTRIIGRKRFLYCAESDCIDSSLKAGDAPRRPYHYLELKTTGEPKHQGQLNTLYRTKYAKWWAQCFYAGISHICTAFRNDEGLITRMEKVPITELSNRAERHLSYRTWRPDTMLNFTMDFYDYICNLIVEECDECQYLFNWRPSESRDIRVYQVPPDFEHQVLPEWYKREMTGKSRHGA